MYMQRKLSFGVRRRLVYIPFRPQGGAAQIKSAGDGRQGRQAQGGAERVRGAAKETGQEVGPGRDHAGAGDETGKAEPQTLLGHGGEAPRLPPLPRVLSLAGVFIRTSVYLFALA